MVTIIIFEFKFKIFVIQYLIDINYIYCYPVNISGFVRIIWRNKVVESLYTLLNFISITLYPAHSRVLGHLVLKGQSVNSLFSAEFKWHCVLSGGTQRRSLPRSDTEEHVK